MRVQPAIGAPQIQSTYRLGATDRFVPVNVFVPIPCEWPTALSVGREREFWDWVHCMSATVAGEPLPPPVQGVSPYALRYAIPKTMTWGQGARRLDPGVISSMRRVSGSTDSVEVLQSVRTARGALSRSAAEKQVNRKSLKALFFGPPKPLAGESASLHAGKRLLDQLDFALRVHDTGLYSPQEKGSEFGFLFLDRTRIRPVSIDLGEHFDSIALVPGQEAIYEVRSSLRRSVTVEDAIEREYEDTLERTSQLSSTDTRTSGEQDTQNRSTGTTTGLNVGVSDPTGAVPVEASSNTSQNSSLATAATTSSQVSTTVAATKTSKVSSRIRQNHRTTIKRETQETFETLTRSTMRNSNPGHAVTLHYYKVMQRLEFQQERTGVRLCWAPFVSDPGANLRVRALRAYNAVVDAAIGSLSLPPTPAPPKKEFVPSWKASEMYELLLAGMGCLVMPGSTTETFEITLAPGEVLSGNVRVRAGGDGAQWVVIGTPKIASGPDSSGKIVVEVPMDIGLGIGAPVLEIAVEVEVLNEVPGYEEAMAEYQTILRDREIEVSRLLTSARREVEPEAQEAMRLILATTDVRDELLGAVFGQLIQGIFGVPNERIERWHRIFDFEQLGYVVFPGWHRLQRLPMPDLGARHLVNIPVARAFLPIKRGYERQALNLLISLDGLDQPSRFRYGQFLDAIEKEVDDANKLLANAQGIVQPQLLGAPWHESIPTAGSHVEMEVSVTSALDALAQRQQTESVDRLHEDVLALREENRLRGASAAIDKTVVRVGPSSDR